MISSLALREQIAKGERIGPQLLTAGSVLDLALGGIEKGMHADLVILDANPLDHIENIRKIRTVVAPGRVFDRQELDGILCGHSKFRQSMDWNSNSLVDCEMIATVQFQGIAQGAESRIEIVPPGGSAL